MYRVLIVDDEKMIRMGMKNAIDWKKLEETGSRWRIYCCVRKRGFEDS